MRLLIISDYYLPGFKAGGPIKSISTLCNNIKNTIHVTIMTSNHDLGETNSYDNIEFDRILKFNSHEIIYLSKVNFVKIKLFINKISPDVIYLNSFFSKFTQIILLLKKLGIIKSRIVLAPRGELSLGALSIKPIKKSIFIKILKFFNIYTNDIFFHSTDEIEFRDIKKLFSNKTFFIPNLIFYINPFVPVASKKENELKIIFLSRITKKKNLLYALDVLVNNIYDGKIKFDIYGPIEDEIYWKKCEDIIIQAKHNIMIKYKGSVGPRNVMHILSKNNVFFLPTKNENFGHAIVEAMQCGLVPIISDQTPWNDLQKYNAGFSLNLKNRVVFRETINQMLISSESEFQKLSKNAQKYINSKIDNEELVDSYIQMFSEVHTKTKNYVK